MGALKMKSLVSDHQKLMTIESQHQSWSSCNTGEVAEELNVDHSVVVQHLKQIGKVKKLNKLVPHELTKKKKKSSFWCVLLYATTTNHFSIGLWHETKSRLYTTMAMTSSVVGSRRSSNETSKAKFEPPQKKVMVTVWWTAAHLVHYSSLNPSESITSEKYTQQISEMHRKLEHLEPARVNRKGPILLHNNAWQHVAQPTLQKLNELGDEVLPLPPYPPDLSPTDYHFFKQLNNFL